MTVKFRYKDPAGGASKLINHTLVSESKPVSMASENFRFAAAVAEFGMLLRNSAFKSAASYDEVIRLAQSAKTHDSAGYRKDFIQLVNQASQLALAIKSPPLNSSLPKED